MAASNALTEERLINVAQKGLSKTVTNICNPQQLSQIRSTVIDEALQRTAEAALSLELKGHTEEADKRWKVIEVLCNLTMKDHRPSQELINFALEKAEAAKRWELVDMLKPLSTQAPSQDQKEINPIHQIRLLLETYLSQQGSTNDFFGNSTSKEIKNLVFMLKKMERVNFNPSEAIIDVASRISQIRGFVQNSQLRELVDSIKEINQNQAISIAEIEDKTPPAPAL